jgi:hypothetical protein
MANWLTLNPAFRHEKWTSKKLRFRFDVIYKQILRFKNSFICELRSVGCSWRVLTLNEGQSTATTMSVIQYNNSDELIIWKSFFFHLNAYPNHASNFQNFQCQTWLSYSAHPNSCARYQFSQNVVSCFLVNQSVTFCFLSALKLTLLNTLQKRSEYILF